MRETNRGEKERGRKGGMNPRRFFFLHCSPFNLDTPGWYLARLSQLKAAARIQGYALDLPRDHLDLGLDLIGLHGASFPG